MTTKWTTDNILDQGGRVAIITGANVGLGYETALALVGKGATVIVASRDESKGQSAIKKLRATVPSAKVEYMRLDLANLASVREFAGKFKSHYDRLDLLINNAGVMAIPRRETADGFEMQFGTNHLGHFALTGLLLDLLLKTSGSRVITTSSAAHYRGHMNFDDLQSKQTYNRYGVYSQSKLANVLFSRELQRRLTAAGYGTLSLSAHPGYAATNLQNTTSTSSGSLAERILYPIANRIMAQSAAMGALPQLYAATAPEAKGGEFIGPRFKWRGYPVVAKPSDLALDDTAARRLWEISEELTGVQFDFAPQPASSTSSAI